MKRIFVSLFLALAASFASAQAVTATLVAQPCAVTSDFCYNVKSDILAPIPLIYMSPAGAGVIMINMPDGSTYQGTGTIVGNAVANYPVYKQPGLDQVIYVTAIWHTETKKGSCSGRGGCQTHIFWYLDSGSLLLN